MAKTSVRLPSAGHRVQLCMRSPQAPAALQQKAWHLARLRLPEPSFSLSPSTSSNPPDWPSKPFPRQGALKDSSVVWGSQKCQAGDSGSDQQAASPQPDPPLSWLTDPQQLWPLPPGAGGWGLTDWRVSSLEAAGEGGACTPGAPNRPHSLLQPPEAGMKGSGNVFLWGSKWGRGQRGSPSFSHPVPEYKVHTCPAPTDRFPPLVWRARLAAGATSPLGNVFFFFFSCWVKTHCAKQHSPELVAPPPGHSSHPSCTGPKKVRHEKCPTDPPFSPTALRGSIQPLEQPCSDQEQAAQPVRGQAGDRALP